MKMKDDNAHTAALVVDDMKKGMSIYHTDGWLYLTYV